MFQSTVDVVAAPAYFLHEQETVAVTLGSAAALECHAYGELPITVYWFYKGKPLKEGSYDRLSFDVQNLSDSVKSTVRISRSQRTDSGVYSCKAVCDSFLLSGKDQDRR